MSTYKYYQTVEKKVDVSPCPCCGHEDLKFYDWDRDDSMHGAEAGVVCNNCGHKVKVDGKEIESDDGHECKLYAIDKWNSQYKLYRNPKCCNEDGTVNYEELEKLLKKVVDELEKRWNIMKYDEFETNVQLLTIACAKLYNEKTEWEEAFHKLAERYSNHLDKTTESLKKILHKT